VYFFGVQLGARNIQASPTGWDPNDWTAWDPLTDEGVGSDTTYNNNWIDVHDESFVIAAGSTLSGFEVLVTDATAPSSVPWFAYSFGSTGTFADSFITGPTFNPGFAGTALLAGTSIPEPGTMLLLLGGIVAGLVRRFRKSPL
jgi:hypothetical protein